MKHRSIRKQTVLFAIGFGGIITWRQTKIKRRLGKQKAPHQRKRPHEGNCLGSIAESPLCTAAMARRFYKYVLALATCYYMGIAVAGIGAALADLFSSERVA